MSQTWQVRSLDVWGHSAEECECDCTCEDDDHDNCDRHDRCEGYSVNQSFAAGEIQVDKDATDETIIATMIDAGYLKEAARGAVVIDDFSDGTFLSVDDASTGEPLYHLQLDDQY